MCCCVITINGYLQDLSVFSVFTGDVGTVTGVHAALRSTLLCTRGCAYEFPPEQPRRNKGEASKSLFFTFVLQKRDLPVSLQDLITPRHVICSLLWTCFILWS